MPSPDATRAEVCLVTGASGMLGAALCKALLDRGEQVRTFSRRDPRSHPSLANEVFEQRLGDLSQLDEVVAAMRGCARVYHVAGTVSYSKRHSRKLYESNVIGTENILAAARST